MKRSEMIRLICAFCNFNTFKTIDDFSGDYMMNIEEASSLLNMIETQGMVPPKAFFVNDTVEGMLNKWEPEESDDSDNYCGIV